MNRSNIVSVACLWVAWGIASSVLAAPPSIQSGSWTLAILPDTQIYSESYPAIYNAQTQFLVNNKTALNLAYVLHEGDITDNNNTTEWARASSAMQYLDNAGISYSLCPGNHDLGSNSDNRTSLMSNYFPVSRLAARTETFGGVYPGEPTSPHNSYSMFSAGGTDWLVLSLEFGPRDQIVAWADSVLKQYPDRQAMILTHAYLYSDNTRYDYATYGLSQQSTPYKYGIAGLPGGVNDGQEMWDQLKDNPNLQFVFCGHVLNDGTGYLASTAEQGNVVHQILANYQFLTSGGNGYMRLLEFLPDGQTVHVRTYSPYLDSSWTTPDQDFVLTMTQVPEPSAWILLVLAGLALAAYARRRR
ncbi:MAG: metallophosphoesterase [Pirellulales bacterium]|nr:metallophosphoesterase [Pirellulales bacterium]